MNQPMLTGTCHCGRLRLTLRTGLVVADTQPRACDCSFCRQHRAAWLSDPAGALVLQVRDDDSLSRYRQGSESAEFLLCRHCGVLMAVVFEDNGTCVAAVNTRCLDADDGFAADVTVSPQTLSPEEKRSRWRQLWIPDVSITSA